MIPMLKYPKVVKLPSILLCFTLKVVCDCTHLLKLKLSIYNNSRVSLLAYSPLAMGILSGKYFSDDMGPADARLNLFKGWPFIKEVAHYFYFVLVLLRKPAFSFSFPGKYSEAEFRYNLSKSNVRNATKVRLISFS